MKFKARLERLITLVIIMIFSGCMFANIDFANFDSTIAIRPSNSKICLRNIAKVKGWEQLSIIKSFGDTAATNWREVYSNSSVIAQSGGTITPPSDLVVSNSNAVNYHAMQIRTNSNGLAVWERTTSNALLYGLRTASNTSLFLNRTMSNALMYGFDQIVTATSSLEIGLASAFEQINGLAVGVRTNSNALLASIAAQSTINTSLSSAISAVVIQTVQNTNQIIDLNNGLLSTSNYLAKQIRVNSNAMIFWQRTNSNAIVWTNNMLRTTSNYHAMQIRTNSNAMLHGLRVQSNALVSINNLLRTTSEYHAMQIRTNSNAMVQGLRVASNYVQYELRTNSNALLYGLRVNSNAIVTQGILLRTVSNAVVAMEPVNVEAQIRANSNAIVKIASEIVTIDTGPSDIVISDIAHDLHYDIYLSNDHALVFLQSCTINGNGHTINFARSGSAFLNVAPGKRVILSNVVLRGYDQNMVTLGDGAELIFSDGATVELTSDQDLTDTVTFMGVCTLQGNGNSCDLGTGGIVVGHAAQLLCEHITFNGLAGTNIRCFDDTATLSYKNTNLTLSNNVTFTSGYLGLLDHVVITGSYGFAYASQQPSVIASASVLCVDRAVTLSYQPPIPDKNLFHMQDASSVLFMNGASLCCSTTGMQLTKGTIVIDGITRLYNDGGLSASQGFIIGDGVASDDLGLEIMPGAQLSLQSGALTYANVGA